MQNDSLLVHSKLPDVKTTIFQVMSTLATKSNAINLGQGFPDFDCDPQLIDAVHRAMLAGYNQYPPMAGIGTLRTAISQKVSQLHGRTYDADADVTVTAGATQALMSAILAFVQSGDEVLIMEPAYDSYIPSIKLAGGTPVLASLEYDRESGRFHYNWEKVKDLVSQRTRLLIINSPHNPTGTCLSDADLSCLSEIVRDTNILILSDEVYEHMVFDGKPHRSLAGHPELSERSIIVSSFGKTYHVTGWKIGYALAPQRLMTEFRKVHQFNVFTANSVMQVGLAEFMNQSKPHLELSAFYQQKRDYFREGLANTGFKLLACEGSYFQCLDYSQLSKDTELDFATYLTQEVGVAAIPISAFYHFGKEQYLVRFCFAKKQETLASALEKLRKFG